MITYTLGPGRATVRIRGTPRNPPRCVPWWARLLLLPFSYGLWPLLGILASECGILASQLLLLSFAVGLVFPVLQHIHVPRCGKLPACTFNAQTSKAKPENPETRQGLPASFAGKDCPKSSGPRPHDHRSTRPRGRLEDQQLARQGKKRFFQRVSSQPSPEENKTSPCLGAKQRKAGDHRRRIPNCTRHVHEITRVMTRVRAET